ncbi:MAG: hypothetical protein JXA33_17990 [Anaerolineae bacterium]|nr:hypothetical protein [Anaerolineae bacterium]
MTAGWKRYTQAGLLAAWGITLAGYFGPWVGRRAAALAWNAYDLFDLLRLLPEIETGALSVNLQALRLPLVGLAVLLPALLADARPGWRIGGTFIGVGLAMATFPPYPEIVNAWHTPGWCMPFWWAVGAILATGVAIWIAPRLEHYRSWTLLVWLAVTGLPAAATFARLLPALHTLHAAPIAPGWGFWACMGGLSCSAILLWTQALSAPHKLPN